MAFSYVHVNAEISGWFMEATQQCKDIIKEVGRDLYTLEITSIHNKGMCTLGESTSDSKKVETKYFSISLARTSIMPGDLED
jgi:hypothetical protein